MAQQVNLTLLVVAEVTPGLPTTCDVQVSVKVTLVNMLVVVMTIP